MPLIKLEQSLPSDWSNLSPEDRSLVERFPAEYRRFLEKSNGGFPIDGSDVSFNIPIERRHEGKVTSAVDSNEVGEFFSLIPSALPYKRQYGQVPASLLHEHWGRHASEEFLPVDVVVFASCAQSCLLALSLNADDFGSVYYWEWFWRYPWFAEFFNTRIAEAEAKFQDIEQILADTVHPEYTEAFNALNYATLIKVADSFSEFLEGLRPAPSDA